MKMSKILIYIIFHIFDTFFYPNKQLNAIWLALGIAVMCFVLPCVYKLQSHIFKYISDFNHQWDVWSCVAVSVPMAGLILWAFQRLSAEYDIKEKKKGMGKIDQSLWYTFGSFFTQGK